MTTVERLRALLAGAEREKVEEEAFLRKRPKVDWLIYTDRRAVSEAAVNALPALLDVAEAALAYLASDGSGVRAEGRWSAPFDAMDHAKALGRLRAALARLGAS